MGNVFALATSTTLILLSQDLLLNLFLTCCKSSNRDNSRRHPAEKRLSEELTRKTFETNQVEKGFGWNFQTKMVVLGWWF